MNKVIMLCGPAAAGKTYYSKHLLETPNTKLFSPDKWLEETSDGKYNWTPERRNQAWAHEYQTFQQWLMGADLATSNWYFTAVWDATFVNPINRSPVLHFSKGAGMRVEAWVINTPAEVCLQRNAERPPHRRVPDASITRMIRDFTMPTLSEGFDHVRIIDPSGK